MERPPRLARRLLRSALPDDRRDDIEADLDEVFREKCRAAHRGSVSRAQLWYWREAVAFSARFGLEALRGLPGRPPVTLRRAVDRVGARGVAVPFSWLDVKLSIRRLVRHWGLTLVGGLAMTTAIAIGAVVFGVIDAVSGSSLPLVEGDRVVALQVWDRAGGRRRETSVGDLERWRTELRLLEDVGAFQTVEHNLISREGPPQPITVAEITASGLELARVPPVLGRLLTEQDEADSADPVVVIGFDVWRTRFASDPDVVGRSIQMDRAVHTVVGVMPEGFAFPLNNRYWKPLRPGAQTDLRTSNGQGVVFARLARGVTIDRAQSEVDALGPLLADGAGSERRLHPRIVPYTAAFVGDVQRWQLRLVYGLCALLLLPPCANLAILIYARTVTRRGEFATRHALGASRSRIVVQLFLEMVILASAAGLAALLLVRVALELLVNLVKQQGGDATPFWIDVNPSADTVLYVAGLVLLAAAVAGLIPGLRATRWLARSGLGGLGGRTGPHLGSTWTAMIVAQVAFSVAAIPVVTEVSWGTIRPGLLGPGFAAERYLAARLEAPREASPSVEGGAGPPQNEVSTPLEGIRAELVRRLESEPDVTAATMATGVPGEGAWRFIELESVDGVSPASPPPPLLGDHQVQSLSVDPSFFQALGFPLLAGRSFDSRDLAPDGSTVMVSETFARQVLGDRNPVGHRLRYVRSTSDDGEAEPWHEIVGVVGDLPANEVYPRTYHPAPPGQIQSPRLILRVASDATGVPERIREIAAGLDPTLRVTEIRSLDAVYRQRALGNNIGALALGAATLSVLLLSWAGMYALMSFTVSQRRREVGIRSALGANPTRLLASIFGRALGQLTAGALVGALVAVVIELYVPVEVIQVLGGWDVPGALPATAALILVVGVLATVGPAYRGLRIAPTEAMRAEP